MKSKGDFVMKSFSKAFGRIVLILTVVIALVASVFAVPKLFGINPYVVLSGSMEPQIHTGAIAFVNTKDTAVKVGDVVTYRLANDELVTHRIIKKISLNIPFRAMQTIIQMLIQLHRIKLLESIFSAFQKLDF